MHFIPIPERRPAPDVPSPRVFPHNPHLNRSPPSINPLEDVEVRPWLYDTGYPQYEPCPPPPPAVHYVHHVPVQVPVPVAVPCVPMVHVMPYPGWVHAPPQQQQQGDSSTQPAPRPSTRQAPTHELNSILKAVTGRRREAAGPLMDVTADPQQYDYTRYDRRQLDSLATTPACSRMKIIHANLPWDVIVRAKDRRGVTVRDVLDTIWSELNCPVSETEAKETRGHYMVMRYRDRYSLARENGDRYAGLRRIDWLKPEAELILIGIAQDNSERWKMIFESDR